MTAAREGRCCPYHEGGGYALGPCGPTPPLHDRTKPSNQDCDPGDCRDEE